MRVKARRFQAMLGIASIVSLCGTAMAESELQLNPGVLTTEHVDVFTVQYNGSWNFFVDDEDNSIFYDSTGALNFVAAAAKSTQPAGSQWEFLGAGAGNDVWILPQSQDFDLLFAGARTIVNPGTFSGGMQIRIRNVEGPGEFAIYNSGTFGTPTVRASTANGIDASDAWSVPAPGHVHYNWGFTAAGIYEVEISASGNFVGGGTSDSYNVSDPTKYYFAVDTPLQVASLDNRRLMSIDSAGDAVTVADTGDGLVTPLAVTYDFRGNRYVADTIKNEIVKFDLSGNRTTFANITDGILFPSAVAFKDSTSELFVANYINDTIVKLDTNGNSTIFSNAADGVDGAFGLAFDNTGSLFMSDIDTGKILKFDSDGNSTIFADGSDGLVKPMGLAFDDAGNLYVSDTALSKIYRFDTLGNSTVFADILDGILFPTGITFDPFGDLYVGNYINSKIIKLDSLGNASVFADGNDGLQGSFGLDFFDIDLPTPGGFALFTLPELTAVPEASSLTLASLAIGCALWLRRRGRLV